METRMKLKNLDLTNLANEIVLQLKNFIEEKKLKHAGELFEGNHGRLFFRMAHSENMDTYFLNNELIEIFDEKIKNCTIQFTVGCLEIIQREMVEDFFYRITETEGWKIFWAEQEKMLVSDESKYVLSLIAGAFSYKLMMSWSSHHSGDAKNLYYKITDLNAIFKNNHSIEQMIKNKEIKINEYLDSEITGLINNIDGISNEKIKDNECIGDKISNILEKTRNQHKLKWMRILSQIQVICENKIFLSLPYKNQVLFLEKFKEKITEFSDDKKRKVISSSSFRELIECVLLNVMMNYFTLSSDDLINSKKLFDAQIALVKCIKSNIKLPADLFGVGIKKEYKDFFQTLKDRKLKMQRSSSMPNLEGSLFSRTTHQSMDEFRESTSLAQSKSEEFLETTSRFRFLSRSKTELRGSLRLAASLNIPFSENFRKEKNK